MAKPTIILCAAGLALSLPGTAYANGIGNWTLSPSESKVAFGSIKKGKVGESHHFKKLTGKATDDGNVIVSLDLSSVETWADIRNTRMLEHVFDATHPTATLKAKIDPAAVSKLKAGDTTIVSVKGSLTLNGKTIPVETDLFVARLNANKVMVTTDEMIMVSTADLGIDEGINKLQELAKLPGITRATPITVRFVFTQ